MIARFSSHGNSLWKAGILVSFILYSATFTTAQDIDVRVNGGFLSDSLKIGEPTAYYLSARYPSDLTVLFPDSTHAFAPFEYEKREYFATKTRDGISADSTVYYLTTFEIDRVQFLSLPVYVVQRADCTMVQTLADSVLITQFVAQVPDTVPTPDLPLKENTAYQKVIYNLNTVLLFIILTLLIAAGLLVWVLFGTRISRYFALKRLQKNHTYFVEQFDRFLTQLRSGFSPPTTESALLTWKEYMEKLEARPYTKLTTKEMVRIVRQPELTTDLSRIDRAIYGHDTAVVDSLENLKRFADLRYRQKLKEVQHG